MRVAKPAREAELRDDPRARDPVVFDRIKLMVEHEAVHQAGRTQDGFRRGHGSGDRAPASAGPRDLSHAQAAVPTG